MSRSRFSGARSYKVKCFIGFDVVFAKLKGLYSYRLQCPQDVSVSTTMAATAAVSLWDIFSKVRWESFAWGAGTALGELPPYFVARAGKEKKRERESMIKEKLIKDCSCSFWWKK